MDDAPTYRAFEALFRRMGVAQRLAPYIDHASCVRLFSAFFVVRTACAAPNMHVDYAAAVGTNAMTLMTPIDRYTPNEGFQLLFETYDSSIDEPATAATADSSPTTDPTTDPTTAPSAVPPLAPPAPPAAPSAAAAAYRQYQYELGKAVAFASRFKHSTEPGSSNSPQAYLCFTFGSDKPEHWPLISDTIGYQSRLLARPDGALVMSPSWLGLKADVDPCTPD